MSEHEGGSWVGPFVLGFVLGVLLCLGGGATIVLVQQRNFAMMAEQATQEARMARDEAEMQRRLAEEQQARLEKELKEVKDKIKEEK